MDTTRRKALQLGSICLGGALGLASTGSRTAMASDAWGSRSVTLQTDGGSLSTLMLAEDDLDVSLEWKSVENTETPIGFDVLVEDVNGPSAGNPVSVSNDAPWEIRLTTSSGDDRVDGSGDAQWAADAHPAADNPISLIGEGAPFPNGYFTPGEYTLKFHLQFDHPDAAAHSTATVNLTVDTTRIDAFDETTYESRGESLSDKYAGNLTNYQRISSPALQGTHSLQFQSMGSGIIYRSPQLERGFQQGDSVRYTCQIDSDTGDAGLIFAVHDGGTKFYYTYVRAVTGYVRIARKDDSGYNQLANKSVSPPTGEPLSCETLWDESGQITFTVVDSSGSEVASISATDTTYSDEDSTNVGWRTRGNSVYDTSSTVVYDDLRFVE